MKLSDSVAISGYPGFEDLWLTPRYANRINEYNNV
jgi:hypothetical protein